MPLISSAFLEAITASLLPYFASAAADIQEARTEIMETLAAYGPRTRTEFLQSARIIALSMTTLDVLAEAKTVEMSQSMRIRFHGCANGLNRSTMQVEKSLDTNQAREAPQPSQPVSETVDDLPDTDPQGATEPARVAIDAHRAAPPATNPRPVTLEARNKQLWAGAMMDTLRQMGHPVQPVPGSA